MYCDQYIGDIFMPLRGLYHYTSFYLFWTGLEMVDGYYRAKLNRVDVRLMYFTHFGIKNRHSRFLESAYITL